MIVSLQVVNPPNLYIGTTSANGGAFAPNGGYAPASSNGGMFTFNVNLPNPYQFVLFVSMLRQPTLTSPAITLVDGGTYVWDPSINAIWDAANPPAQPVPEPEPPAPEILPQEESRSGLLVAAALVLAVLIFGRR